MICWIILNLQTTCRCLRCVVCLWCGGQAQLTSNRTSVCRIRNAKTAHTLIRPTVLLSGERDLIDLLGLHRPSSTSDSSTDTESALKTARSRRRDLPPLHSTGKLHHQHNDYHNYSSSGSRSPPRSTGSASGTDSAEPDETRRPKWQTNLNTKRRPSTAGEALRPTKVNGETVTKVRMRSRSAPPTTGSRTTEAPIRIPHPERGSLLRSVRFVPSELVTDPEVFQSRRNTRNLNRDSQATHPGTNGARYRHGARAVPSGKAPCKRKGELKRVAKTTIRITFSRPASSTSVVDDGNDSEPRPVGYEPDVAEWYRAKRRSRLPLGIRSAQQTQVNGNTIDYVDGVTDITSFSRNVRSRLLLERVCDNMDC